MICFVIQNSGANHCTCISTQTESPSTTKKTVILIPVLGGSGVALLIEIIISNYLKQLFWKLRTNHWVWFTCDLSQRLYVLGAIESYLFIHRTVHRGLHYPISPQIPKHDDVTYKCEICMNEHSYTNPQITLHNNHPQQTQQRSLLQNTPKGVPF